MTDHSAIDREAVRQDISRMAFREIRADRSLNIDQELGGDEIQSILERLCKKYNVDDDAFWSKIDFDKYFYRELNLFELAAAWVTFHLRGRPATPAQAPFTIDDVVRLMRACARHRP